MLDRVYLARRSLLRTVAGFAALGVPNLARGRGRELPTPKATGNQVYINASKQLTTPLPLQMWGQSMENNDAVETLWNGRRPTAQGMKMPLVRILWKNANSSDDVMSMSRLFPSATRSIRNTAGLDVQLSWLKANAPGAVYKLDPEYPRWYADGTNIRLNGTDAQLQAQYRALAQYCHDSGVEFTWWEGPGEWPGNTPANSGAIAAILQAGVKQVSADYKLSGPGQDYTNHSANDMKNGWLASCPNPEAISWDVYWWNSSGYPTAAQMQGSVSNVTRDQGAGDGSTGVAYVRSVANSHGLTSVPLICSEFNWDSDDSGLNGSQQDIAYVATQLTSLVNSGCNVIAACHWHMHSVMLRAKDWSLCPMANYYRHAVSVMGGYLVDKSVGSGVASGVLIMPSRRGPTGSITAAHIVNSDLSNPATISLRVVGWSAGNVTQWQSNSGAPGGSSSGVSQASLSNLVLPASSVTMISGTVA